MVAWAGSPLVAGLLILLIVATFYHGALGLQVVIEDYVHHEMTKLALLLFGWSFALFYHLCNGIRHLVWDAGYGFEMETATLSGWIVVGASAGLTLICWIAGYIAMGG